MESSLNPSIDLGSHIDEKAPPSITLAQDTATAVTRQAAPEWRAGRPEALIMAALMIVSLIAALDATVLVPVLPVSMLAPTLSLRVLT